MKYVFLFLGPLSWLWSCRDGQNGHAGAGKGSNAAAQQADTTVLLLPGQQDTTLGDTLRIELNIGSAYQHVTVPVHVTSGKQLFAELSSAGKKDNIRIGQIEFPDGTFDGPFGRKVSHSISDTGWYKIIISEDMMAGDRWKGKFRLKTWTQ